MGSLLSAECSCGYQAKNLFLGGGMLDFLEVCNAPAVCQHCEIIFTDNYQASRDIHCPRCKKEALYYDHPSLLGETLGESPIFFWRMDDDRTFILPNSTYYCPKCKRMQLRFIDVGMWD